MTLFKHIPVLADEVVSHLITDSEGIYIDGTAGSGGHSERILQRIKGKLICIDKDPDAIERLKKRFSGKENVIFVKGNYADMDEIFEELGIDKADGILLDLGLSSEQIELSGRGFSFLRDEILDMRFDPDDPISAKDIVNRMSEKELARIIREYGEERKAKKIARAIVAARKKKPVETSLQLAKIIESVVPKRGRRHPATKTFQAIRIAVNRELENLEKFLKKVPDLLKKGGRVAIISYHSLEDRLVKQYMNLWENPCTCPKDIPFCICGKKAVMKKIAKIKPSEKEIEENIRARSAILRIAERL